MAGAFLCLTPCVCHTGVIHSGMADIDWTHGADHMARRGITVEQANEALTDPNAVVFDPDYNSQSGRSVRTIGYSFTAATLLTIITITDKGVTYGASGWKSNSTDRRHYREGQA